MAQIHEVYDALREGKAQPWQRDASAPELPEVGRACCLGCLAQKIKRELRGLKKYPHTCLLRS